MQAAARTVAPTQNDGNFNVIITMGEGGITVGTHHRAQLKKVGNTMFFAFDENYDGTTFSADRIAEIDLATYATFLTDTTSRIFFGTSNPTDSFDDLLIQLATTTTIVSGDFSSDIEVKIEFDSEEGDSYKVEGEFNLGASSDGIDPFSEDVVVTVGTSTITIPAGLFVEDDDDGSKFKYEGEIDGVVIKLGIKDLGSGTFDFEVKAEGIDLTGTDPVDPVDIELTIGDDSITGTFALEEEEKKGIGNKGIGSQGKGKGQEKGKGKGLTK